MAPTTPPQLPPSATMPGATPVQTWTSDHTQPPAQPISHPNPQSSGPTSAEAAHARTHLAKEAAAAQQSSRATISDAWKSIKAGDFLSVHEAPCSRTGFLTGIGSGAGVGALRFVLGSGVPKAANWAVGAGVLGAVVSYEVCQAGRRKEREKMKRVVEVYDRKQAEERARDEERKRARMEKQKQEEEEAKRRTERRSWWKVW